MHGITQRELAGYLGLSPQGVWNIVHGRSEPRSSTAMRAARAFGIDTDALFADTGACLRAAAEAFERAPIRAAVTPAPPAPVEPQNGVATAVREGEVVPATP